MRFVRHFREATGRRHLCLAGGVALNVKMNSHLRQSGLFDDVFVFPIPSDSGTAIGAALGVYHQLTGKRPRPLDHLYLGPEFSDEDIERQISSCGLRYRVCDDIAEATADLLVEGKVVGWFQGRMEGGPRALGGRSILADPRSIDVKGPHWVEPVLVAHIGFTEWTRDGRLRHPRFLGLRDDKAASEVVRER